MKKFIISGVFRSGTTFLARALNAHSNLAVASDPFFHLFKEARNRYFSSLEDGFDMDQPLFGYENHTTEEYRIFLNNLDKLSFDSEYVDRLRYRTKQQAQIYSPRIIKYLDQLEPGSYLTLLDETFRIVRNAYGSKSTKIVGYKEVWTDEFIPNWINSGIKVLQVIRDPRAVVASNRKSQDGSYPILFLIRQWRKSVSVFIENLYHRNYKYISYEELVTRPKDTFDEICQFLSIPFESSVVDANSYQDGDGNSWSQNSSYKKTKTINSDSREKWKEVLTIEEVALIEELCQFELRLLNYDLTRKEGIDDNMLADLMDQERKLNFADWIKKYDNFHINQKAIAEEKSRILKIKSNQSDDYFLLSDKVVKYLNGIGV